MQKTHTTVVYVLTPGEFFSDENWWLGPQTNRQTRRWYR
jgi:hypothetical protein